MTGARGGGRKNAWLTPAVEYLQTQRVRMLMMMKLAEATTGLDVYLVGSNNTGGTAGRGGRPGGPGGEPGGDPAAPGAGRAAGAGRETGAAGEAGREGGAGRGRGRGAGGGGQGPTQRHFTMANLACYPAINVPNGFAPNGQPTNVVFYARPFGEAALLALARAYQDAAGFHLQRPAKLDATTSSGVLL